MNKCKSFRYTFCVSFLSFILLNAYSLHYRSTLGITTVVGWHHIYDGVKGFGFPFLVFEVGGFDGRQYFNGFALVANLLIAYIISLVLASSILKFSRFCKYFKKGDPTKNLPPYSAKNIKEQ